MGVRARVLLSANVLSPQLRGLRLSNVDQRLPGESTGIVTTSVTRIAHPSDFPGDAITKSWAAERSELRRQRP